MQKFIEVTRSKILDDKPTCNIGDKLTNAICNINHSKTYVFCILYHVFWNNLLCVKFNVDGK